jgi:energy-converting hydrogenase Eha subunit F
MKSVKLYVILAFALIAIFGVYCRKNVGPTDLYLKPDPFPSEQSLIISAINY